MKFDWFSVNGENPQHWLGLCPPNTYRIISPNEVPALIPRGLLAKADSVIVMASGTMENGGTAFLMANINRVDYKAQAIDQQPFALAFIENQAAGSACLIHHGNWRDRTINPPPEFWNSISASGIGNCYPISELPNNPTGNIHDLKIQSHINAFDVSVTQLKKLLDGK